MFRIASTALLSLGLAACMSAPADDLPALNDDQGTTTISVSELQARSADGSAYLDLQRADIEYQVDSSVDLYAVDVACPSGQTMNLGTWVADIEKTGADFRPDGSFRMFSSGPVDEIVSEAAPPCFSPCYLHQEPDRTWVCFGNSECGGTAARAEEPVETEAPAPQADAYDTEARCPQYCSPGASCTNNCACGYYEGVQQGVCHSSGSCLCY